MKNRLDVLSLLECIEWLNETKELKKLGLDEEEILGVLVFDLDKYFKSVTVRLNIESRNNRDDTNDLSPKS